MLTFQLHFVSKAHLIDSVATESREVSLNGNVYDFSFNYNFIDKSDILIIHRFLMTKYNIKYCPTLLNKCLLYY